MKQEYERDRLLYINHSQLCGSQYRATGCTQCAVTFNEFIILFVNCAMLGGTGGILQDRVAI